MAAVNKTAVFFIYLSIYLFIYLFYFFYYLFFFFLAKPKTRHIERQSGKVSRYQVNIPRSGHITCMFVNNLPEYGLRILLLDRIFSIGAHEGVVYLFVFRFISQQFFSHVEMEVSQEDYQKFFICQPNFKIFAAYFVTN